MPDEARVCVVIPTYNEKENIVPIVEALESLQSPSLSVIFVDDSSPDGTGEEVVRANASRAWVRLLVRKGGRSFSAAYQEGIREAMASFDPFAIVGMDADLQHPVSFINLLVNGIKDGADVAIASRYVKGGGIQGWSLSRRLISRGANWYSRRMLGLPVRDCTSGFKAFGRSAAQRVAEANLQSRHFEYQIATLKVLKDSRIVEIPYTFVARKAGTSKLGLLDLPRFFVAVLKMRFSD